MKRINLTNSPYYTIVDDEDYERAIQYQWHLSTKGYVIYSPDSGQSYIMLHNFIMNIPNGSGVDHINQNKLDNYKANLRIATNSQQGQNRGKFRNNKSGFRGVCWHRGHEKYGASIRVNYKQIHLGYFVLIEDAARAYDKAAIKYFGDNAALNFKPIP